MARSVQVTFDASDSHDLAAWRADLLGDEVEDGHDVIAGLLRDGVIGEEIVTRIDGRLRFADACAAGDPDGSGPRLFVQRVPEPKTAKNRAHLDIRVAQDDLDAEVERVVAAGATLVGFDSHPGQRWAVLQGPDGNEFCLT